MGGAPKVSAASDYRRAPLEKKLGEGGGDSIH